MRCPKCDSELQPTAPGWGCTLCDYDSDFDELEEMASKAPSADEVDQGHGTVYLGHFLGQPVFSPKLKCIGCELIVAEPTDCAIYHESCPSFGTKPDVNSARIACGLSPIEDPEDCPHGPGCGHPKGSEPGAD